MARRISSASDAPVAQIPPRHDERLSSHSRSALDDDGVRRQQQRHRSVQRRQRKRRRSTTSSPCPLLPSARWMMMPVATTGTSLLLMLARGSEWHCSVDGSKGTDCRPLTVDPIEAQCRRVVAERRIQPCSTWGCAGATCLGCGAFRCGGSARRRRHLGFITAFGLRGISDHVAPDMLGVRRRRRYTSAKSAAKLRDPFAGKPIRTTTNGYLRHRMGSKTLVAGAMMSKQSDGPGQTRQILRGASQFNGANGNGGGKISPPASSPLPPSQSQQQQIVGPIPSMPSQVFLSLANSQFELLANSLVYPPLSTEISGDTGTSTTTSPGDERRSKIKSMALYLPQENVSSGQLEFIPAVLYPCPTTERIFIASDSRSGLPPTIPRTLTKLPGFAHAQSIIPAYPFASSASGNAETQTSASVGIVEEVMCDITGGGSSGPALSVSLFCGSRTVGVLLVWPAKRPGTSGQRSHGDDNDKDDGEKECTVSSGPWTEEDKMQISRAANSIALALLMDTERAATQLQTDQFQVALSDSLHQVKNPLQALRTFGKLLQRQIAMDGEEARGGGGYDERSMAGTPQLLALAERMMVQSERVVDLLQPMDSLVLTLERQRQVRDQKEAQAGRLLQPQARADLVLRSSSPQKQSKDLVFRRRSNKDDFSVGMMSSLDGASPVEKLGGGSSAEQDIETSRRTYTSQDDFHSQGPSAPESFGVMGDADIEMAFVPDVIEEIVSSSKAIASESGIDFEVYGVVDDAELPGVCLCPKLLREAVANVLDNAIKYVRLGKSGRQNNRNPAPCIRLHLMPNREPFRKGVTILVEDNGPGIPPSEREAVFERGFRGDATRLMPGSGIGLDISRSMVSRMGGILDVVEHGPSKLGGTAMRIILFREPDLKK